jgi:peptide/nickel transport system permease protein
MTQVSASPTVRFQHRSVLARLPWRSRIAAAVVIVVGLVCLAAPLLGLPDPLVGVLTDRMLPVGSPGHVLGTDTQGRDMLSRLVFGTRTSLVAGLVPIVIATAVGTVFGAVAGFATKWVSVLMLRVLDIMFAFPGVLLSLLLAIRFGVGLGTLILALTMVWLAPVARITETEVARIREAGFVIAAQTSGAPFLSVLVRQILPVTLPAVLAYSTSLVGASIAIAGGLGFIGLGVPSPQPELGAILQEMQSAVYSDPLLALLPVLCILALSTMFPIVGDGIRQAVTGKGGDE